MTKSKTETTSNLPVEKAASAVAVNSLLQELGADAQGLVQVRRDLIKVPRVKVANKLSTAFDSGLAKIGDFYCEARSISFGPSIEIIPVMVRESASLLPKGASIPICSTNDLVHSVSGSLCVNCPHGEYWNGWGTKANQKVPGCKHSIDMTVIVVGDEDCRPMELSFRKNNSKAGKMIVNFMVNDPRKIPFGSAYRMVTSLKTQDTYTFHCIEERSISKRSLSDDEIIKILPVVKNIIQNEKAGNIQREDVGGDDIPL